MDQKEFIFNFASQFEETEKSKINFNTEFKHLEEWCSLLALSVIAMCDEEYNVKISGDDIREIDTVGDLYDIVKSRI